MTDIQNNKRTSKNTEIDFGVINDSSDGGNLYIVCLWPGYGYFLSSTEREQESHAALARGRNANIF